MRINSRHLIGVLTVAVGIAITGGAVQAIGAPFFQGQGPGPDYSKNKRYQQGMREGQADHAHNLDHSKKRHFKKDEDQQAYEAGYQKGHGN
jgi:hypothetical protein